MDKSVVLIVKLISIEINLIILVDLSLQPVVQLDDLPILYFDKIF